MIPFSTLTGCRTPLNKAEKLSRTDYPDTFLVELPPIQIGQRAIWRQIFALSALYSKRSATIPGEHPAARCHALRMEVSA